MKVRSKEELQELAQTKTLDWMKIKVLRHVMSYTASIAMDWGLDLNKVTISLWMDQEGVAQITIGNRVDLRTFEQPATMEEYKAEEPEVFELFQELIEIVGSLHEYWDTSKENIQFLCYTNDAFHLIAEARPKSGFPFSQSLPLSETETKLEDWGKPHQEKYMAIN